MKHRRAQWRESERVEKFLQLDSEDEFGMFGGDGYR